MTFCRLLLLRVCLFGMLTLAGSSLAKTPTPGISQERECMRKMRRLLEAVNAYRRLHDGKYPETITALSDAGFISEELALCPCILKSRPFSSGLDGTWSSSGDKFDSNIAYQYELSGKEIDSWLLPEGRTATWREMKTLMLDRPHWGDIPLFRCERHFGTGERLNLSFAGHGYISGTAWEELFVKNVPLTYRTPYSVFHSNASSIPATSVATIDGCLNLSSASNAFPEDCWWWGNRTAYDNRKTATFQSLLEEVSDGFLRRGEQIFDIRRIIQLQGTKVPKEQSNKGYVDCCFPQDATIPINLHLRAATVLTGTVWPERPGNIAGSLNWRYADQTEEAVLLIVGQNIDCFRGRTKALSPFEPAWEGLDSEKRSIFLFAVEWTNPHPDRLVTQLDFRADPGSRAAPFVIAITLQP